MRTYEDFVSEFCDKDQEIIVYVTTGFGGAMRISGYYNVVSYFPAMVDPTNNQLIEEEGRIELLVSEEDYKNKTYSKLSDNGIYRLLVTKSIPKELTPNMMSSMNNRYLLKRVLNSYESLQAPLALLSYREDYMKEVSVDVNGVEFVLDRKTNWYKGSVPVLGNSCSVMLCLDKGSKKEAYRAVDRYKCILGKISELDQKIKDRCANDLIDLVNEWKEDESNPDITIEEFKQKIALEGIVFSNDDKVEFSYSDGNLFGGHVLLVNMDPSDEITSCDIAG